MLSSECVNVLSPHDQHVADFFADSNSRPSVRRYRNRKPLAGVLGFVLCLLLSNSVSWAGTSTLQRIRTGFHDNPPFTRLVFELEGDRPTRLEPSSDDYVIAFQQLQSEVRSGYPIRRNSSFISSLEVSSDVATPKIIIKLRYKGSLVSSTFLPAAPPHAGRYRLVVDVFKPKDPESEKASHTKPPGGQPQTLSGTKTVEENEHEESKLSTAPTTKASEQQGPSEADLPPALKSAKEKQLEGDYQGAYNLYVEWLNQTGAKNEEKSVALYGLADCYYAMHKNEPEKAAKDILDHYLKALKADPAASQAPWALYRCGQAYEALGDWKQAFDNLQRVVQKYPSHSATPLCWLSIGRIHQQNKSYVEAIEAFRSALGGNLEKDDRIQANWHLGECLYLVGQHAKAIEALEQCLHDAPEFYRKEPHILRCLGESYFVCKEYGKSRDYLFWYLNISPGSEDRDLILARIAEIFLVQEEPMLANKLHDYIQIHYPDSEGNVICKIRKAEYLERKDKNNQEEALAIYQELCEKQLPVPLLKLVRFKFALWHFDHGNFEESLRIIDDVLRAFNNQTPNDDFIALRKRVIIDWSKNLFEKKDYARIVQLYEANSKVFAETGSSDLESMIAESYGKLKLCKNAVALFQQIRQKERGTKKEALLLKVAQYTFLGGDLDKAIQYADQVQDSSLEQEKTLLLGRIYFARKDYPKVIDCFNSLQRQTKTPVKLNSDWSGIYGESLMNLGEYEKALPWLKNALEEMKKNDSQSVELVHGYLKQSVCYRAMNDNENAVKTLEEALSVAKSEEIKDQLNYDIANLYIALGQKAKATERLTKLLNSQQGFWQIAAKQQLGYIQLQQK